MVKAEARAFEAFDEGAGAVVSDTDESGNESEVDVDEGGGTTGILALSLTRKARRRSMGRRVSFAPTLTSVREYEKRREEWMTPPPTDSDSDLERSQSMGMGSMGMGGEGGEGALASLSLLSAELSGSLGSLGGMDSEGEEGEMGPALSLSDFWTGEQNGEQEVGEGSVDLGPRADFAFDSDDVDDDSVELTETFSSKPAPGGTGSVSAALLSLSTTETLTGSTGSDLNQAFDQVGGLAGVDEVDEDDTMTGTVAFDLSSSSRVPNKNLADVFEDEARASALSVGSDDDADDSMEMTSVVPSTTMTATAAAFDATPASPSPLDDSMEMTTVVATTAAATATTTAATTTAAAFDTTPASPTPLDDSMEMTTVVPPSHTAAAFDITPASPTPLDESMEMTTVVPTTAQSLTMDAFLTRTSLQVFTQFSTRRPTFVPPPPLNTENPVTLQLLSNFVFSPELSILSFGCDQLEQITIGLNDSANETYADLTSDNAPFLKAFASADSGSALEAELIRKATDLKTIAKGRAKLKWYDWVTKLNTKLATAYSRNMSVLESELTAANGMKDVIDASTSLTADYTAKVNAIAAARSSSSLAVLRSRASDMASANSQLSGNVSHLEAQKEHVQDELYAATMTRNALKRRIAKASAIAAGLNVSYERVEELQDTFGILSSLSGWSIVTFHPDTSIVLEFEDVASVSLSLLPSSSAPLITSVSAECMSSSVFANALFDSLGLNDLLYMDAPLTYEPQALRSILDDLELHLGRVSLLASQLDSLANVYNLSVVDSSIVATFNSLRSASKFAVTFSNIHHSHIVTAPLLSTSISILAAPNTPISLSVIEETIASSTPSFTRLLSLIPALDAL